MPANADKSNAKRVGNHPSSPQETRKSQGAAASAAKVLPGAALQGTIVWLGRKKLGWSQEVLAGKSNYDVKTIQNVENGRTTKADTFRVLRDLLVRELANGNFPTLEELLKEKQQQDASQTKPAPAPAEEEIPDPIQKLINRAKKLTDDDRFGEAIPGLEKALKLAGDAKHRSAEAKIRLRLGHALFEGREEYTGAEEHFRKALELAGESPTVSGPATMLPPYMFVSVPSAVPGEGHVSTLSTPHLPQEAIDLMTRQPIKELIRLRAAWFPSPRHDSKDAFLTDLRVSHERGLFPVYFDRLPTSDGVSAIGGVQMAIPAAALKPEAQTLTDKWKRALLKITRLEKSDAQAALLDLPDTFAPDVSAETASLLEVVLFEFTEIGRKVIHPALLVR